MPHRCKKLISLTLCLLLLLEQTGFAQTVSLNLSKYLSQTPKPAVSDTFRPLHLRYLSYDNSSNNFQLLLDKGSSPPNSKPALEQVTQELLKYFLIGLALPNEKFWVNLRPDSPDDILDPDLEKTDIGRIFLEADVQLKKDTAGATSPQTPEGKQYWDKLYKKTGELFGSENITIPTITRPWIVPDEVIIRESPEGAYIYKATLKVMLEEDYLKSPGRQVTKSPGSLEESNPNFQPLTSNYSFSDPRLKELNEYSTQLIKETIIPKLTRQINTSKRYAPLRQVYYSLILAQWFKAHYREQLTVNSAQFTAMENNYLKLIDSGDLTNLASKESYDKQAYFKQYQESFRDGEYNLQEPVYTPMGKSVRRYMSGGMQINCLPVIEKIPGTGSPMLSRGLTFTKKYIIYLLAALPLATFSPQISVRAGTLPAATPEVINDDLRPNNLPQNMILYKGRLFEDLSDKMQRLLNNKSALSGENNEIEEAIRSVRRDLVIVTSNLSNLSAEDLIKLSNVWGKVNKIYKSARVGIYQQPWLRENKIFMDMIVELAFRFFNLEQRTKSENTLESLDILNIVFYIFSDCMLAEGNKLKETYLTHILNKGPTNEAIKDVGSVSYFSGKGRRSPDFNKKGLDFLKLSFGDKKYYSQDILKLNAPSYIKLYLWYSWAIEASLDNLKKDSVNIRNLAKSFLEEYKNKSINDIRVIFVEHENKKEMSGDGRDAQLTGPIDYWQIANIIALAIDLYEDAELNNILAYDFTLQGDIILLKYLSGISLSIAEEANSKYKFGLNAAHDAAMRNWFLTGAHEITHNATLKIWGKSHIDLSIAEFIADLNAFAYFQQKSWPGYNKDIENFMKEERYDDKMNIIENTNGFSNKQHDAARAQLGFIKKFLEGKYGKVDWIILRNVVFKELEIEPFIGFDELSRRALAKITGGKFSAEKEKMPADFSYRIFIPPGSSSPMESASASSEAESGLGVLEIENSAAVSSSIGGFPVINLLMNYLSNGGIKKLVSEERNIRLDQWSIPANLLPKVSDIVMWFPSRLARQIKDPVKLKNGGLPDNLGGIACTEFVKIDLNKSASYEQLAHVIWHELIHEFSFLSLREGKPALPVRAWKKIAKEAGFYGALVGDKLVAVENLPEDYALWEKLGYGDWVYNENGGLYCYVQKERYEKLKKAARYDTNGITLKEYNEYWKTTPFESVAEAGAAYLSNSDYANDGVSRFGMVARMVSNTLFAVQEADGSMWKYEFNRKNNKKLMRRMTAEEISEWKVLHGVLLSGINVSAQPEIYLKPYSQVRLPYKEPMQLTLVPDSSDNKVELGVYSFQDLPERYKKAGFGKETSFFMVETAPGLAGYKELKSGETMIIGRESAGNFTLNGFVSGRHVTIKNDGGGYVIFEDQNSPNKTKVVSSSMNLEKVPKDLGGIDLSRINKSMRTESVSAPASGAWDSLVDADFDVNEELAQLQKLINAQIVPSADRLNRYARVACSSSLSSPESRDSALSLVAETFRLQEEMAAPAATELKALAAWLE